MKDPKYMGSDYNRLIHPYKGGVYCTENYPIVDWDKPDVRSKDKWLHLQDIYVRAAHNYDTKIWDDYKGIITWNSKIYDKYKDEFPMKLLDRFSYIAKYEFTEHTPYKEKLNKACLVATYFPPTLADDAKYQRYELCKKLSKVMPVDIYGSDKYPEDLKPFWRGYIPSKLGTITNYKWSICFENCAHEPWAWDYVTEKIWDCFLSKVVPIYYGAPNVADKVPKHLYIDYRDYIDDFDGLVTRLNTMTEKEYTDMTEEAHALYQEQKFDSYLDVFKKL